MNEHPANLAPPGARGWRANARAVRSLLTEPTRALTELAATYGSTFQLRLGPKPVVVVGDPGHVDDVLGEEREAFRWGRVFRNLRIVVGKGSVLVSDGEEHRRRRRAVQPGFALRHLDAWTALIVAETDRIVDEVAGAPGAGPVEADLCQLSRLLVRRIMMRLVLGPELGRRADAIGELLEPAMSYATQPVLRQLPHPLPFTRRARARAARRAVDRLLSDEMRRRRVAAGGDPDAADVLDALMGEGLSDAAVRDQAVTLIAAGYDTTAAGLGWLFARSLGTPGVWDRLRAEAETVLDGPADAAALRELRWSDAVVHETLRLHPPGAFAPREATRTLAVGPYRVRRGALVLWSPYLMGRDAEWWDDPLAFRPERHGRQRASAGHRELAWAPFGRGVRSCLGFALAQAEMTLIASRLAQRLDVELASDRLPAASGMVVSRPAGGLPCRLARRRTEADVPGGG